jgi:threonine dehydrogenase-like Zn-dependent dehydrogenase
VVVPGYSVHALPDHVTFKEGAYMEPIAASLAVLNANIRPEQKGLIYGDNRISRLTERIMKIRGFKNLEIFDHESGLGGLQENSYDFIIETLITTETMQEIVGAVKPGGTIVLKSRQHTPVAINVNTLVMKDITMQAVGYGDFAEGIKLVASGALKTTDLFGDVFPLEQYARVFKESERGESLKLFFSAMERDVWDR